MNPYFRSSPLVPLVKKMSEDLRALEIEYNYLSTQINPENESKYPSIEILCRKGSYKGSPRQNFFSSAGHPLTVRNGVILCTKNDAIKKIWVYIDFMCRRLDL